MTEQPKDGGAAFDLAQMIADRDAGTPGEWFINGPTWNQIVWTDNETRLCFMTHSNGLNDARDEANARRIARVPLLEAEIIRLTARVAALEDALDPNLTKADYIGEVKTDFVQAVEDEDGDIIDQTHEVMISWTAMKQFMAMISARAALSTTTEEPRT